MRLRKPLNIFRLQCCGVREVSSQEGFRTHTKETFENWLRKNARIGSEGPYRYLPKLYNYGRWSGGVLLATANDSQIGYQKWLSKVGFKKIRRFQNHNTRRMVNMYLYTLRNGERNV
jgi:hypothetical protein